MQAARNRRTSGIPSCRSQKTGTGPFAERLRLVRETSQYSPMHLSPRWARLPPCSISRYDTTSSLKHTYSEEMLEFARQSARFKFRGRSLDLDFARRLKAPSVSRFRIARRDRRVNLCGIVNCNRAFGSI